MTSSDTQSSSEPPNYMAEFYERFRSFINESIHEAKEQEYLAFLNALIGVSFLTAFSGTIILVTYLFLPSVSIKLNWAVTLLSIPSPLLWLALAAVFLKGIANLVGFTVSNEFGSDGRLATVIISDAIQVAAGGILLYGFWLIVGQDSFQPILLTGLFLFMAGAFLLGISAVIGGLLDIYITLTAD